MLQPRGVDLNAYNANVDFNVSDTADAIAKLLNSGSLGKAAEVFVVSGGDSVDVAEAEATGTCWISDRCK